MDYATVYGGLNARVARIDEQIQRLQSLPQTPQRAGNLARLAQKRQELVAQAAARQGAQMALAQQGVGLPGSGIRGVAGAAALEGDFTQAAIQQYNQQAAVEGQRFSAAAPAGSGRLNNVPFVVSTANTVPIIALTGGTGALGATTSLVTISINWALIKIVGIVTQQTPAATGSIGVMQDFKVGGSANLFLTESWVSMTDYDVDKDSFGGLRAYPVLRSPNQAQIDVATYATGGGLNYVELAIVVDVLRDDAFGPGIPGAYAA